MFDGKTYEPSDGPRLGVQLAQVASLMRGGQWRRVSAGVFQYRVCA